ncbi:MAG: hypothetical protein QGF09_13015 [Rhodospirillales bacterium]|jgi:hypothetical protein|nr:hypothetical protein [Rhodospirillales bacterium]
MLEKTDSAPASTTEGGTALHIWLFGGLSSLVKDRPAIIEMPKDFTATDVIAEMGKRYGQEFLDSVTEANGEKIKCCKIFLDGLPVEDVDWPLETEGDKAEMEMILLAADEGG